jgi:hypothetical protein
VPWEDIYEKSVFINCPFSSEYQGIFRAILFAVYACGFRPRCALEVSDSSVNRLAKIEEIIKQSRFAIHDISFMEIDKTTGLARLNMAFELGLFMAAKKFGGRRQKRKNALIMDKTRYRYRKSLSDISGHDIEPHNQNERRTIRAVRDWLNSAYRDHSLPGGEYIAKQFVRFSKELPTASKKLKLNPKQLTFPDVCRAIESWLKENA